MLEKLHEEPLPQERSGRLSCQQFHGGEDEEVLVKTAPNVPLPSLRDQSLKTRMKSSVWLENELKAYHWTLVALSGLSSTLVEAFVSLFLSSQGPEEYRRLS